MKAIIINIGDELLIGQTTNTNAAWMGQYLNSFGIEVESTHCISDKGHVIFDEIDVALYKADVVVVTGGLGPTKDDITKKTIAKFFNDQEIIDIKDLFTSKKNDITFFHSKKYKNFAKNTKASFCLTTEILKDKLPKSCTPLIVENVLVSTSKVTSKFYPTSINDNFDYTARDIAETKFKDKVKCGKNVLIGDNVTLGSNCLIGHNTIIEQNVSIGDNCWEIKNELQSGPAVYTSFDVEYANCGECQAFQPHETWLAVCCNNPSITQYFRAAVGALGPGMSVKDQATDICYLIESCSDQPYTADYVTSYGTCFDCSRDGGIDC